MPCTVSLTLLAISLALSITVVADFSADAWACEAMVPACFMVLLACFLAVATALLMLVSACLIAFLACGGIFLTALRTAALALAGDFCTDLFTFIAVLRTWVLVDG